MPGLQYPLLVEHRIVTSGIPDSSHRALPVSSHNVARTGQASTSKTQAKTTQRGSPGRHICELPAVTARAGGARLNRWLMVDQQFKGF